METSGKNYPSMSLRAPVFSCESKNWGEAILFLWEKIAAGKNRPRNDKALPLVLFAAFFCVSSVHAQENIGTWSSVETGPVISQGVPMNVKVKTPDRVTGGPEKFQGPSGVEAAVSPAVPEAPDGSNTSQAKRSEDRGRPDYHKEKENESQESLTPPLLISVPEAIPYPRKAIRRGWEGQVLFAYEVLPDGSVGRMEPVQSSGHALLDEAARESIKKWKFRPALRNGLPFRDVVETPVTFKLEGHGEVL